MKRLLLSIISISVCMSFFAQSPEAFTYQAVVRDNSGNVVSDQAVGLQIEIIKGSTGGEVAYTETHTKETNKFGLVTLEIGHGTTGDDFTAIEWGTDTHYLRISIDLAGGNTYEPVGTSQLLSVPYALHAKTAESVAGEIDENDPVFNASEASKVTAQDIANLSNLSGVNSGDQDLSGLAAQSALEDTASSIRGSMPDVSEMITVETDPLYSSSVAGHITAQDTVYWNSKLSAYTETDPEFTLSEAAKISPNDITNLANLSGVNTGDQDISNFVWMHQLVDSLTIVRSEIPEVNGFITTESDPVFSASASSDITHSGSGSVMTDAERTKLQTIADGAEVNVQGDWNESSSASDSYILNKPSLATVALTGDYSDLSNTPVTDGSETKINAGDNINVSGSGTEADPYEVSSSAAVGTHYPGELYGGGVVFYTWANGQHGFIASLNYLSTGTTWNNAINLCNNYSHDGYDDWFLPDADLMKLMFHHSYFINNTLANDGDASTTILSNNTSHWTSSHPTVNTTEAYGFNYNLFSIANFFVAYKDGWHDVRAAREF